MLGCIFVVGLLVPLVGISSVVASFAFVVILGMPGLCIPYSTGTCLGTCIVVYFPPIVVAWDIMGVSWLLVGAVSFLDDRQKTCAAWSTLVLWMPAFLRPRWFLESVSRPLLTDPLYL